MGLVMGFSKIEVNLRRLLASAPQQPNHAKLIHYVATLREYLEQLAQETIPEGLPRVSKAMMSDYSEKIEAIASKLASPLPDIQVSQEAFVGSPVKVSPPKIEAKDDILPSPGLRRRPVPAWNVEDRAHDTSEGDHSAPVKLDAAAHTHIEKHRKLQDDLTDEMVELAQQLKESSLMMCKSIKNTEKILDSTEKSIEHSLAGTNRVNTRAMDIYSKSFKTTCFSWLVIFVMMCIFIMVVLLIRVT